MKSLKRHGNYTIIDMQKKHQLSLYAAEILAETYVGALGPRRGLFYLNYYSIFHQHYFIPGLSPETPYMINLVSLLVVKTT